MAISFMSISRRQSAITSHIQSLLTTKKNLRRKTFFRQKSSQAFQSSQGELFSPLDPRELAPRKSYPLAGVKHLVGSDGKGFPEFLEVPRQGLPLAYKIQHADQLSVGEWAQHCRKLLDEKLPKYGAVLFRGLPLFEGEQFSLFTSGLGYTTLDYLGYTTDRPTYDKKANVFLSSAEPQEITIEPHNEMAYRPSYPQKVIFHCNIPPAEGSGGWTPITRNSEVLEQLDPDVVQKFEEKKIRYYRNLPCEGQGFLKTWERTFKTNDRKKVEKYLEDEKVLYNWNKDGSLHCWNDSPATIYHPLTREKLWFNQLHMHHHGYWKELPIYTRFSVSKYPTNTAYGDGSEIEPGVLHHIRNIIWKCTVGFEWQKSDTLILDNIQVMHARLSFTGDRRILAYLSSD